MQVLDELERLAALWQAGALSDDEFAQLKAQVLRNDRIDTSALANSAPPSLPAGSVQSAHDAASAGEPCHDAHSLPASGANTLPGPLPDVDQLLSVCSVESLIHLFVRDGSCMLVAPDAWADVDSSFLVAHSRLNPERLSDAVASVAGALTRPTIHNINSTGAARKIWASVVALATMTLVLEEVTSRPVFFDAVLLHGTFPATFESPQSAVEQVREYRRDEAGTPPGSPARVVSIALSLLQSIQQYSPNLAPVAALGIGVLPQNANLPVASHCVEQLVRLEMDVDNSLSPLEFRRSKAQLGIIHSRAIRKAPVSDRNRVASCIIDLVMASYLSGALTETTESRSRKTSNVLMRTWIPQCYADDSPIPAPNLLACVRAERNALLAALRAVGAEGKVSFFSPKHIPEIIDRYSVAGLALWRVQNAT